MLPKEKKKKENIYETEVIFFEKLLFLDLLDSINPEI